VRQRRITPAKSDDEINHAPLRHVEIVESDPGRAEARKTKTRGRRIGTQPGKIRTGQEDHYVGETSMMRIKRKLVGARSLLALEFLTVTDAFTRDITDIVADPTPLVVNVRGEMKQGKPHYMIAHENGRRDLVMVHTVSWLTGTTAEKGAYRRDFLDGMAEAARRKGYGFRLVTEEQIYVQPRLANAKLLRRHLVPYRSNNDEIAAIEALGGLPEESSVAALQETLGKRIDAFVVALRLDWLGHLKLDRRTHFSRASTFVKT
jgi:hypothetical protein